MLKLILFIYFYICVSFKGILTINKNVLNDYHFLNALNKNGEFKIQILEPECTYETGAGGLENEFTDFNYKEILMHDFIVIKDDSFTNEKSLKLYHNKHTQKKVSLILSFFVRNLNLFMGESFPFDVILSFNLIADKQSNGCQNNLYSISLLKSIELNSPSDIEISETSTKVTISKSFGILRVNITSLFLNYTWKESIRDKIFLLLEAEGDCYAKIENKLSKPLLIIEKQSSFYTEWSNWSKCSMECEHFDNIQIRERSCSQKDNSCFKGDFKEIRRCSIPLPKCDVDEESSVNPILKMVYIFLPIIILISILIILYNAFYKKKGIEKELYENVAGRFLYG